MKKIVAFAFIAFCLLPSSFCQIKIIKATSEKTMAGVGGVFMKYAIEFTDKKNAAAEIDSVKTIADASILSFYFKKQEPCCNEITFSVVLLPPAKCKTCVDTAPVQQNLTKGVIIYYKKAGKKYSCKVKKFQQLEDKFTP